MSNAPHSKAGLELPDIPDFSYEDDGLRFFGKRVNWEPHGSLTHKYKVDVFADQEGPAAYMTFYVNDQFAHEVIFSGMYVSPHLRGVGMSRNLLRQLFNIAHQSGRDFVHARAQRKPLTASLLQKSGFIPIEPNPRELVVVGAKNEDGKVHVYFPNRTKGREFANSKIAHGGEAYVVEPNIEAVRGGVAAVLNTEYLLIDPSQAAAYLNLKRKNGA